MMPIMTAKVIPGILPPVFLLYYFYFNFNGEKIKKNGDTLDIHYFLKMVLALRYLASL